jgi:hypothetical protein
MMWKEAVIFSLKILNKYLLGGIEELSWESWSHVQIQNHGHLGYEVEVATNTQ